VSDVPLTFRRAVAGDVPALVALLADDVLGAQREQLSAGGLARYSAAFGQIDADPNQFLSGMQSFAVATKVNRARQYMTEAFANGDQMGTPAFVVAGKYRVKGKSVDDMFRIMTQLIAQERAKLAAPATAPAAPTATPGA